MLWADVWKVSEIKAAVTGSNTEKGFLFHELFLQAVQHATSYLSENKTKEIIEIK